tara:strand:- start:8800 stop:9375 length:576 start_codon:yes stop_codon:yes gene_type:complete
MLPKPNYSVLTSTFIGITLVLIFGGIGMFNNLKKNTTNKMNNLHKINNQLLQEVDSLNTVLDSLPLGFPLDTIIINDKFGIRKDPILKVWRKHQGIDLEGTYRDTIYSTGSGTIVRSGWRLGYGRCVEIKHIGGYKSLYAHMNKLFVKKGDKIKDKQKIGTVGSTGFSTGTHLHYEISRDGKTTDPEKYLI